jgi:hypothetical protein
VSMHYTNTYIMPVQTYVQTPDPIDKATSLNTYIAGTYDGGGNVKKQVYVQSFSDLLNGKGGTLSLPGMRLCVLQQTPTQNTNSSGFAQELASGNGKCDNAQYRGCIENNACAYAHNPTLCDIIYAMRNAHNIEGVFMSYDVRTGTVVYNVTLNALYDIHDRIMSRFEKQRSLCRGCIETFAPPIKISVKGPPDRVLSRQEIQVSLCRGCIESHPGPRKRTMKKGRKRKRIGKGKGPSQAPAGLSTYVPRAIGFPDSSRSKLRYIIPLQQVLGGGTTNSLRFTSNAYDVDTALASTAMASFAEYAAVYSRFRTLRMHYCFRVSNSETFPQGLIFGFMTNSVGATALGQNYAGNKHMRTTILSPVNGSTSSRTLSGSVSMTSLFGGTQPLYDDLFTGSTTSSTLATSATANCYIGSVAAAVPVNGWFVTGFIELDVLFVRRNALLV